MLDPDHAAFIQSAVSISLASCRADHLPCMNRGLGCKVLDQGQQIAVFLNRTQAAELLDNIHHSGKVASVFSLPSSNRTVQLKGIDAQVRPFDPADLPVILQHIDDFSQEVGPLGFPDAVVRAIYAFSADDLVTVCYTPHAVFSQTPGPQAGTLLA